MDGWLAVCSVLVSTGQSVLPTRPIDQCFRFPSSFSLHRAPPSSTRIPQDLFIDIVEAKNFLACALTGLFANTEDSTTCLPSPLVLKVCHFKDHLSLPSSSGI
ncbi:uncharacterized protein LOC135114687 isoform X2 [Scylla paramamosain]|uniref:uncharacterized protein LOC135114687 isoform X2 n=1 Tax=Scylla paramamosain TaxID=85552 RepID=UPI0030832794